MKTSIKRLGCNGCGAGLAPKDNEINVQCDYCGVVSRVTESKPSADIEEILVRLFETNVEDQYAEAKRLMLKGQHVRASEVLDQILKANPKAARAWFLKSMLPILDKDTVLYKGHYVNLTRVSKLKTVDQVHDYLAKLGVPFFRRRGFIRWYQSTDFLYEQQVKFLEKAIEFADAKDKKVYQAEMDSLVGKRNRKKRRETLTLVILFGLFLVAGGVAIGFMMWYASNLWS